MKKLFVLLSVVLLTLTANAQIEFGAKAGVNITSMRVDNESMSPKNRPGFYIGPSVKVAIPLGGLGVDASLLYDQREAKIGEETAETGNSIRQKQFAIPINLRYDLNFGDAFGVFAFAGPQFGFNISKDRDVTISQMLTQWEWKKANVCCNFGIGVKVLTHMQISANYNMACTKSGSFNLSKYDSKYQDYDGKLNSWQISLAYYF